MESTVTKLVYYIGADGPTVIITACNKDWIHYFKRLLIQLKDGSIDKIDFTKLKNTETSALVGFTLASVKDSKHSGMHASHLEDQVEIEWFKTTYEIETLLGLVDSLLEHGSGFQFLNLDSDDDVLLVLSTFLGY